MNKILITAEGTCDLTPELCSKYNIEIVGMNLNVDGVEYNTKTNPISSEDFYTAMKADKKVSTSLVNEYDAKEFLETYLKQGYDIVHIGFSRNLSGTFNNFISASEQLKEVYGDRIRIVDSLTACIGQGFAAILVSQYNDGTKSLDEVANYAKEISTHISHIFIVDSLKYLARTGRISKLTAGIGTLLQIKPVLHADDEGRLTNIQKVISRKKSIQVLGQKVIDTKNNLSDIIFIAHANCMDEAMLLSNQIEQGLNIKPIIVDMSVIIGCHTGPGALAVFYTSDKRV
ncbi:MAG: DegV family protein [Clostridia bacterium]|nr:DegV family protein [Clostridia bacterium]